jgi:hypothetical protein
MIVDAFSARVTFAAAAWRLRMPAVRLESGLTVLAIAAALWMHWRVQTVVPPLPTFDLNSALIDTRPVTVTIAAGGERVERLATVDEVRSDRGLWRQMHLANWSAVPASLQREALDRMLARYRSVLADPAVWDRMDASDWDLVPQPIRTIAYRHMVSYWSGFYQVGAQYALPPRDIADILAAIVMSESWFEHRGLHINVDGTRDIGLAEASEFARTRMRQLHALGRVDVYLSDEDYYNPWRAARFVALWMSLLLDEAGGDLPTAVRAYNRGINNANDAIGLAYYATVLRRLTRFIQNRNAPPAWDYVSTQSRELLQRDWPWIAERSRPRDQDRSTP